MTEFLAVLIDGVIYSSWLFIIAVGLTLVYGVMKIVNVAHGSLYALGAYVAATLVGAWTAKGYAPVGTLAMLLLAAVLVGAVMGPLIERGLLRFMYGKREVTVMLVTYAVFLIMEDVVKLVWGVSPYLVAEPYALLGNVDMGAVSYPGYNVLLLAVSIAVGIALTLILTRTRQGKLLLAVIHDREVSTAMGINVPRFYLLTFSGGALLAAIGGAFTAPTVSVVPAMGVEVIVLSFAVIVIGGMGSLPGAALGAVIVGLVRSLAVHYWPEVELFSIYFVMAMVLVFRPKGLFSAAEVRKI